MGFGSLYISSPEFCFSTEDYNEWVNEHYNNDDDDEKIFPKWFYLNLSFCDECERYIEFNDNKCFNHLSHRLLVTCNSCQNNFRTLSSREVKCFSCCRSIERKLKTYTFDKLKKLASVYNIKRRRRECIIDDLVQKVENYIT